MWDTQEEERWEVSEVVKKKESSYEGGSHCRSLGGCK